MKKETILIFALIILAFAASFIVYPSMPDKIATHWGASGDANGYSPKAFGLFILPVIVLVLVIFFLIIPKIDPLRENIKKFEKYYFGFIIVLEIFMLFIQAHLILWNLNYKISTNFIVPIGIGALFIYIGFLLKKTKRNWFIGIRTPWTLDSDEVWDKTHKLGSKLFYLSGVLSVVGIFFQGYAWLFIIIPVIAFSVFLFVYSYFLHKKIVKKK